MGRPPKKNKEPQKRPVSLVEMRAQYQSLKHQTDAIALAVEKMTQLQAPDVPVRGPARIKRALYQLNGYISDLTAATMRLDLEMGGGPTTVTADDGLSNWQDPLCLWVTISPVNGTSQASNVTPFNQAAFEQNTSETFNWYDSSHRKAALYESRAAAWSGQVVGSR